MEPGRLDVRLGSSLIAGSSEHLAECPDLGPECGGPVRPTPYYHHVDLVASDTSLDASYGVTDWLAAEVRVTLRVVDTTPTYSEIDGTPRLVPNDIHHHDQTLVGPGDPWLVFRFAAAASDFTAAARLGVSIPLGLTQPDPYALGAQGERHEHTQLGTGTLVPIVGIGVSYRLEPVSLSASGLAFFSLYENQHGFRAPSRYFGSLRATMSLFDDRLSPHVAVDVAGEGEEIWHGRPGLEGTNVRADLLVGGGLAWRFLPAWQVELVVRGRAARFTGARGFDYPGLAQLAISTSFDTVKADDRPRKTNGAPAPDAPPVRIP